MKILPYLALAVLLVSVAPTNAQTVIYNFDRKADFSKFKTYKWVKIKHAEELSATTQKQFEDALDAGLKKKGLTKTDGEAADLYIGYQTAIAEETQYTTYEEDPYPQDWNDGWMGRTASKQPSASANTIYVGQLALDMYDSAQKKLVWRGVASNTVEPVASATERQKKIVRAVEVLLKGYPPSDIRF